MCWRRVREGGGGGLPLFHCTEQRSIIQIQWHVPGSSSHLQVVLLLLQSLEAAAVWLALDGHVCLLLQDVQAQLLAAA